MMTGPALVYLLCLITSVGCAIVLALAWRRTRAALLLWSAISFGFLALNNLFVFFDMVVTPVDLSLARSLAALAGIIVLLYGLIFRMRS